MKNFPVIALSTLLIGSAGIADAGPLEFLFGSRQEPRYERRYDDDHDCHDDDDDDDDRGRHDDRSWDGDRDRDRGYHRPMSTEARAQLRLRELGYYRGPIDGSFGSGSRAALYRFQRDNRMHATGWLDERTRRALRL